MPSKLASETTSLLLKAMFCPEEGQSSHQFMFVKPDAPEWDYFGGASVLYNFTKLDIAALHLRQNGPTYLRNLPISDVRKKLTNFVRKNYYVIMKNTWLSQFSGSYYERLNETERQAFASAMSLSNIFKPTYHWAVLPLIPIVVNIDYIGESFSLIKPKNLRAPRYYSSKIEPYINPTQLSPTKDWSGIKKYPSSWLAILSPDKRSAEKISRAILGAIALTILPEYRYSFSGREVFGGICTLSDRCSYSPSNEPHTPALGDNIFIRKEDATWLDKLDSMISSNSKADKKEVKALEYFYRAWFLQPSERFPLLFFSLDSLFGEEEQATKTFIDRIIETLEKPVDYERIRLLTRLRASVIHGGAPDVYDSRKYSRYLRIYQSDPIRDIELIAAKCLSEKIFGDSIKLQKDPHQELTDRLKRQKNFETNSII